VLLLLADGTQVPVAELPGEGPWTVLVLQPDPTPAVEELLGRLGPGPAWGGIAADAPPR
jgi:hypothetical protein